MREENAGQDKLKHSKTINDRNNNKKKGVIGGKEKKNIWNVC